MNTSVADVNVFKDFNDAPFITRFECKLRRRATLRQLQGIVCVLIEPGCKGLYVQVILF